MPYVVQTWADLPDTSTPITAARLTHMEQGINSATNVAEQGGAVTSVNGQTGAVVLTAANVGALTQAAADARYVQVGSTLDQATADLRYVQLASRGISGGIATLDNAGRLPTGQLPTSGIVTTVNGLSGGVTLTATSVGAATVTDVNNAVAKTTLFIFYTGTSWPSRATVTADVTRRVEWVGGTASTPPTIGGTGAVNDVDCWEYVG